MPMKCKAKGGTWELWESDEGTEAHLYLNWENDSIDAEVNPSAEFPKFELWYNDVKEMCMRWRHRDIT